MADPHPSVSVVQCPSCGSPVDAAPGEITACSYCGAPLAVSAGASGYPVARLATIEASTVFLARTEALRRTREQLAEAETRLAALRDLYRGKDQELNGIRQADSDVAVIRLALAVFAAIVILAFRAPIWPHRILLALVLSLFVSAIWLGTQARVKQRATPIESEIEQLAERGRQALAERNRLAERVAELEASLDELASKL